MMKVRGIDDVLVFFFMDFLEFELVEKVLFYFYIFGVLVDDGFIMDIGCKMVMFFVLLLYVCVLIVVVILKYDCLLEVIDIILCIMVGDDIFF